MISTALNQPQSIWNSLIPFWQTLSISFPVAERVEGGVPGPNPTQRESKAANEWPALTLLPVGSNPAVSLHEILSSGKQPR
jgi:hypothetical protein